ncbi:hypothetical protein SCLCIDRAFT_1223824 [Scleroderma citrinum Foug A]|uniref:Uncharacterized protein n=1 Tax=Scleroderma citrinum Foug A TaxID=1036808 RepID=A0A0C3D884_9AGAM|nr:hypothetical protein SCLCIDRAFT_1223824 [Scleroderma citrinum Foug A]
MFLHASLPRVDHHDLEVFKRCCGVVCIVQGGVIQGAIKESVSMTLVSPQSSTRRVTSWNDLSSSNRI